MTGSLREEMTTFLNDTLRPWGVQAEQFEEDIQRCGELTRIVHEPCHDLRDDIFELLQLYRGSLENMRTNIIEAIRDADAGNRPLIHVVEPDHPLHGVLSVCEVVDESFNAVRTEIGYDSLREL